MAQQFSTAVRNAWGDAWESTIGTSAKIIIYGGSVPANCAASASATVLATFSLASDWTANAASGAKTLSSLPLSTTASSGSPTNATHYRIYDSTTTTCHEQGTITATGGGGDMEIDSVAITSGQTVRITAYTKTWAGA